MAEVSYLHLPEFDHDLFLGEISALDSFSFWPHDRLAGPTCGFDFADDFPVENGVVSPPDRKNQVNFVMDLLNQRVEESNLVGDHEIESNRLNELNFGVIEEDIDVGAHNSEVELGLGLGLGFDDQEHDEDDRNCGGFVVSDCGDDFYIAKRRENEIRVFDEGSSSSRVCDLKSVWIESDSEDEDVGINTLLTGIVVNNDVEDENFGVENVNDEESSVPLCWDSIRIEDNVEEDENVEVNRDFEWEEVEGEGPVSVLNFTNPEEEEVVDEDHRGMPFSLDWEVLMSVNTMPSSNVEVEDHDDDFIYTAEYEMMFGQFENAAGLGRPPASKTVVEHLLSVVLTKEDVKDEMSVCAVCKEHMDVGAECKELPCSHRYHGDCIVPWLGIRNTCPVCRFELATDDPDYEQRRARLSSRAV